MLRWAALAAIAFAILLPLEAAGNRKIIIDEDCSGPGGTNLQAVLALIQSPATEVLGITVPTGDAWRDEEVQHVLRLLELIGRTGIPVVPGAVFPLVNRKEFIAQWEMKYGRVVYQGAWNTGAPVHSPYEIPPMPEGSPATKPSKEDAAHFLVSTVRRFPHQVTIYAGGPLTDIAQALHLDPRFPDLVRELVVMGGAIHPVTNDPELAPNPHREFNFWMDPEAAHSVLQANWPRVTLTTVDISIRTRLNKELIQAIARSHTPAAEYAVRFAHEDYLWDELTALAWLDPRIITRRQKLNIDVSTDHGATYGDTIVRGEGVVEVQQDLDRNRFYRELIDLLRRPTPRRAPAH